MRGQCLYFETILLILHNESIEKRSYLVQSGLKLKQGSDYKIEILALLYLISSFADPYVFGPPGSGYISTRSGSGSFDHQAKY
jgi:hypothetical protein